MNAPDLESAVTESIAAFDAANHAFGRFVTYVVRPHNEPVPPAVQHVREGFQDAAVSFPESAERPAAAEFLSALRECKARLDAFLADPPAGYQLEEAMAAPEALDEAIAVLARALE